MDFDFDDDDIEDDDDESTNDPLDDPDFDPVDFINKKFPNEMSLQGVDAYVGELQKFRRRKRKRGPRQVKIQLVTLR